MDKPFFRRWFSRSQPPVPENSDANADPGDANAQFGLGLRCANGQGAPVNYAQAARWYLKAANQNHSLAQFNLGVMYAKGQGMPCDKARSMMWIQKAAHQGDAGAQHHLGASHHRASLDESPVDALESRIEAFKWFQLAAAQGYCGSEKACGIVILNMTHADVADGSRRVAAFNGSRPTQQNMPLSH